MKTIIKISTYLTLLLLFISFVSCKNSSEEKTLKARFIGYTESDLPHYLFKDSKGKTYDFSVIPNDFNLVDENGRVNQKYLNEIFKIQWDSVKPKSNSEHDYPYNEIKTIEVYRVDFAEASEWGMDASVNKCPNCGSNNIVDYHDKSGNGVAIPGLKECQNCGITF